MNYLDAMLAKRPPGTEKVFGGCPRPRKASNNAGAAMNGADSRPALQNDPLAGMTLKQIWIDCVWLSAESTTTKIMLLCIGRFFDDNARSSSMSYAQVARECSLGERTAKKEAKEVRDKWLRICVGKGFHVPGKGPQNLYHGICPPELVERLREQKRAGKPVPVDSQVEAAAEEMAQQTGVHQEHPGHQSGCTRNTEVHQEHPAQAESGVHQEHRGAPDCRPGCTRNTRTPITPIEETLFESADAPSESPALKGNSGKSSSNGKNRKTPRPKSEPPPAPPAVQEAYDLYVALADRYGLPVANLTKGLIWPINTVLQEHGGLEGWRKALAKIEALPNMRGADGSTFRVHLHWLTKNGGENFNQLVNGACDDWFKPRKPANGGKVVF